MSISDLARAISILARKTSKNSHSFAIRIRVTSSVPTAFTAEAKPYQPGRTNRDCDHEKTHGIARRSSILPDVVRDAGREPIFRSLISEMGVIERKKARKCGSS